MDDNVLMLFFAKNKKQKNPVFVGNLGKLLPMVRVCSFETLWVMNATTAEIKEVISGLFS